MWLGVFTEPPAVAVTRNECVEEDVRASELQIGLMVALIFLLNR